MAIRNIRTVGDDILLKRSREVDKNTEKIQILIDDMIETMYAADGVGLAAPQIGVLKRIFIIDLSEERNNPIVLINPIILETAGEQVGSEGCLSVPGKAGIVKRPNYVKVRGLDRDFNEITIEGEGLFARAVLHENEHLDGHIYTESVIGKIYNAGDGEAAEEALKLANNRSE